MAPKILITATRRTAKLGISFFNYLIFVLSLYQCDQALGVNDGDGDDDERARYVCFITLLSSYKNVAFKGP